MAHTFGATVLTRSSAATSPITRSATTSAGDTVLVLMLNVVGGTNRAGGAPTFNGNTFTQANSTQKAVTSPEASVELWYLVTPPITTANIVIPNTGSLTIFSSAYTGRAGAGMLSAFDVANGNNGTSTNPNAGLLTTTVNGDIIFSVVATGAQTWAPSAQTGTALYNTDDGANGGGGQYLLQATAGAATPGWTFGTSDDWGAVGAAFKEVADPNITVGITGVSVTSAISTFGVALAIAASGLAASGSVGTVALPPSDSHQITLGIGTPSSISRGILFGLAPDPSGVAIDVELTGVSTTSAVGSVIPATASELNGTSATGAAGSVTTSRTTDITGVQATGSVGTVTTEAASGATLTGVSIAGAAGSLGSSRTAGLSGVAATSAVGSLGPSASQAVTGTGATGAVGTVVQSRTVPLSGPSAAGAVGTVSAGADRTSSLTGVLATGSVGTVGVTKGGSAALTNVSATGSVGSVSAGADKTAALTGISSTGAAGSVALTHTRGLSGASATGSVGSLIQSASVLLSGTFTPGQVGTVSAGADASATITGVEAIGLVGTATFELGAPIVVDLTDTSVTSLNPVRSLTSIGPVRSVTPL